MRARFSIGVFLLGTAVAVVSAQPPERSVWDGVYNAEQSKRGEAAYAEKCASCHGLALGGGESAPPLTGGEFMANWSGLTVGDLFDRIRTSMPADRPGTLKRQETAEILAYMLNVSQFPAGQTELGSQAEVLKQIKIEVEKPKK